jgi:UrcA family protein
MNSQTLSIRLAHFQAAVRTVGRIALCVAALIVAIAQQSSVAAETSSAKVSLAGLDLSTPEGIGMARERLRQAALLACSHVADSLDLSHHSNFVKCVDVAMAVALPQVEELARKSTPAHNFASNKDT